MPVLRITQSEVDGKIFRTEAVLEAEGGVRRTANVEFDFVFSPQDREDIRWYLEDYLLQGADPAPKIAARIETRIAELGIDLFKKQFHANEAGRDLWTETGRHLSETRIEVITSANGATTLPWELLRDPDTGTPLALQALSFVRGPLKNSARRPPRFGSAQIRILLIICRPGGVNDVPFRSVASRLIRGLGESFNQPFQLEVLRPPTFAKLTEVLRKAKSEGAPFDIVHFDGHGLFADLGTGNPKKKRGYLVFENQALQNNAEFIHGARLGKLLTQNQVSVLVVNACRSAHDEPPEAPIATESPDDSAAPNSASVLSLGNAPAGRGFGSFAQEVIEAGVPGVVAMRYNVYVVTAAQFVADLYASLASGQELGQAVAEGRRLLKTQPLREIAYEPRPLQDWIVPVVFEASPVVLFKRRERVSEPGNAFNESGTVNLSELPPELERRPEVGFFGRDETILAIDRAFDSQQIVLVHGYAGSGKTSTAAEFARWYSHTGGIEGPVFFTSFEHHRSLAQVLNETIGRVFAQWDSGINWLALSTKERSEVALALMKRFPVLWIWDNVETIRGFPSNADSLWSDDERQALIEFLRRVPETNSKILLTSRRQEQSWLGNLPTLIPIPPMPIQERVLFARALAYKSGQPILTVQDWMPLLLFAAGNPLAITVLVNQALREGVGTRAEIDGFLARIRAGETLIRDEVTEDRDKSLSASLSYGLLTAFTVVEQKQVALLHLFEGTVQASMLRFMGEPNDPWCLDEIRDLTKEYRIGLLDRCAELGFLTPGNKGVYSIHPALPQYLAALYRQHYEHSEERVATAFANGLGGFAMTLANEYLNGEYRWMYWIERHYFNLLSARKVAISMQLWEAAVRCMRALRLYFSEKPMEKSEWKTLVVELVPHLAVPESSEPVKGLEVQWSILMEFLVEIARDEGDRDEARRLQTLSLEFIRQVVQNPETVLEDKETDIKNLAYELYVMAGLQSTPEETIKYLEEAGKLYERIKDGLGIARCAEALSDSFLRLDQFDEAERWCNQGLRSLGPNDSGSRGMLLGLLGRIHYEHFQYWATNKDVGDNLPIRDSPYLVKARVTLESALSLIPQFKRDLRARLQSLLANVLTHQTNFTAAFSYFQKSIEDYESLKHFDQAMSVRFELAVMLFNSRRLADALEYAQAVLEYARQNKDWKYSEAEVQHVLGIIRSEIANNRMKD